MAKCIWNAMQLSLFTISTYHRRYPYALLEIDPSFLILFTYAYVCMNHSVFVCMCEGGRAHASHHVALDFLSNLISLSDAQALKFLKHVKTCLFAPPWESFCICFSSRVEYSFPTYLHNSSLNSLSTNLSLSVKLSDKLTELAFLLSLPLALFHPLLLSITHFHMNLYHMSMYLSLYHCSSVGNLISLSGSPQCFQYL